MLRSANTVRGALLILVRSTGNASSPSSENYSHFFHLKSKYGSTAAITIMISANG